MDSILFSSIAQVLVFGFIPLIVYLIRARTFKRFFRSTGLYSTPPIGIKLGMLAGLLLAGGYFLLLNYLPGAKAAFLAEDANAGMIRSFDDPVERITAILLFAGLKTSLAEELLFRGFIGRSLIRGIGYSSGNLLQAVIFGILATVLLLDLDGVTWSLRVFPFLLSTAAGYCAGYLNTKWGNGSIWPGWTMHAVGDLILYVVLVFFVK